MTTSEQNVRVLLDPTGEQVPVERKRPERLAALDGKTVTMAQLDVL